MPRVLAIDTTQRRVSAALVADGEPVSIENADGGASEQLVGVVDRILLSSELNLSDLDALAVALGPGSYTGIRTGMAYAQGLQLGCEGLELLGVPVFAAGAYGLCKGSVGERSMRLALAARVGEFFVSDLTWWGSEDGRGALKLTGSIEVCVENELSPDAQILEPKSDPALDIALCASSVLDGTLGVDPGGLRKFEAIYGKPVNAKTLKERGLKTPLRESAD